MSLVPKRWHRPVLLALGLILGLVVGPVFLLNGVRTIDGAGSAFDMVGGWLMVVGGVIGLAGGLALLIMVRRKPSSE